VEICTIGFAQTTAEHFFGRLADARVEKLLDVRLNNSSQLAPTQQLLDEYGAMRDTYVVSGHRDWLATECPGEKLYARLPELRNNAASPLNPPTGLANARAFYRAFEAELPIERAPAQARVVRVGSAGAR